MGSNEFAGRRRFGRPRVKANARSRACSLVQDRLHYASPQFADFMVLAALQWARLASPHDILEQEPAIARHRERMRGLYGALGDRFPGFPRAA
jgi:hypothetical protein